MLVFTRIDVSEGQWCMVIAHLATAYFGQRFWRTPVFSTGLEFGHVMAIATLLSLLSAILRNMAIILGKKTPLDECGVEIKRRTGNVWKPAIPIAILTASAITSYSIGYFHVSPALFVFTFGFAFAKVTIKLVVSSLSWCYTKLKLTFLSSPIYCKL